MVLKAELTDRSRVVALIRDVTKPLTGEECSRRGNDRSKRVGIA